MNKLIKNQWFFFMQQNPEGLKSAFSLDVPRFWNSSSFKYTCFNFQSTASFLLETVYSFSVIMEILFCIGFGILVNQKWQKCYQYGDISLLHFIITTDLNFSIKVLNEGVTHLYNSHCELCCFWYSDWNLDTSKMGKSSIKIRKFSVFIVLLLESYRLELFQQRLC